MKEATFDIHFSGEVGVGLLPFSDKVTITCESGQWGGEPGEFEEYLRGCLAEWYDGATVTSNVPVKNVPSSEKKGYVGATVRILPGASDWMKAHNFWINDWPESIDGMIGTILHNYTEYPKNDFSHYEVQLEGVTGCGVHPQWLEMVND